MPPTEKNAIFVLYLKLLNFTIMTIMVAKTKQVFRHIECVRKFRNFENRLFYKYSQVWRYKNLHKHIWGTFHYTTNRRNKKRDFFVPRTWSGCYKRHDRVVSKHDQVVTNMIGLLLTWSGCYEDIQKKEIWQTFKVVFLRCKCVAKTSTKLQKELTNFQTMKFQYLCL